MQKNTEKIGRQPFIIWTVRRTGGTNLTTKLEKLSRFHCTEHEPFNVGRSYGHITTDWQERRNVEELSSAVGAELCDRPILKHCVETVPWEVSAALASASTKAGYSHLFLYRRNAKARLLSLYFAQTTGMWGPKKEPETAMAAKQTVGDTQSGTVGEMTLQKALPVQELVRHEIHCVRLLSRAWRLLNATSSTLEAVAFEDLYGTGDVVSKMDPLMRVCGIDSNDFDEIQQRAWIDDLTGRGEQGTRDLYEAFSGVSELSVELQKVKPFSPRGL